MPRPSPIAIDIPEQPAAAEADTEAMRLRIQQTIAGLRATREDYPLTDLGDIVHQAINRIANEPDAPALEGVALQRNHPWMDAEPPPPAPTTTPTLADPETELMNAITDPPATIDRPPPRSKKVTAKKAIKPKEPDKPKEPAITEDQVTQGAIILKKHNLLGLAQKLELHPSPFVSTYIRSKLQGAYLNLTFNKPINNYREACAQAAIVPKEPVAKPATANISINHIAQHMQLIANNINGSMSRLIDLEVVTPEQIEQFQPIMTYISTHPQRDHSRELVNFQANSAISVPAAELNIRIPIRHLATMTPPVIIDRFSHIAENDAPLQPYRLLKSIEVPPVVFLYTAIRLFTSDANNHTITQGPPLPLPLMMTLIKAMAHSLNLQYASDFDRAMTQQAPNLQLHIGIRNTARMRTRLSVTV